MGKMLNNFFLFFMDAGQHYMTGRFFCKLNDAFTQICIHYLYALLLQVFIQVAFFRKHGFALHNVGNAMLLNDGVNDLIMFFRC